MTTREIVARRLERKGDGWSSTEAQLAGAGDRLAAIPISAQDPLATRLLLTPAETCVILSIKKTTLYKWLGEGLLRSRKIGGKRLIQADSVRELSSCCHDGLEPGQR